MAKGDRIKALREKHGLTQEELAEKLGTTKQTIFKYETNVITNIPSDKIEKMAELFGVDPAYLMGWNEDQTSGLNQGYYFDDEAAELAQEIYEDPELRVLLKAKRDLSKDDMEVIVNMIKALQAKDGK